MGEKNKSTISLFDWLMVRLLWHHNQEFRQGVEVHTYKVGGG